MSRRVIVFLLIGLVGAMVAIILKGQVAPSETKAQAEAAVAAKVLVAKRDLSPGSFIQPAQDLQFVELKDGVENPAALREGAVKAEEFAGAIVRRSVKMGEMIAPVMLTRSGEGGFLSAVLEPGMRAISIAVNTTSGAAGFVSPGDRVDLLVTHRIKRSEQNGGEDLVVSETFVHDVRVVAVDQMLDNPENKAIPAKTITVEVSPAQAERVAVAAEMGKVSLSLRSVTQAEPAAAGGNELDALYTRDSDVSGVLDRGKGVLQSLKIIRGGQIDTVEFSQGGR